MTRFTFALAAALLAVSPGAVAQSGRQAAPALPAFDVMEKSILELQAAMDAGTVSARDLAALHLARIDAYDTAGPALNAFISRNPEALATAEALDRERREKGPRGPLHGIPIVIKDNYETADLPTTGGSLALAGFRTGRDAFQVAKLREAGAVILGKTNLHELAAGIITISSLGGQTRNPYDPARTPGGSSGGTGAAVAASFAVAGMASDTCGSIRIPAANNNLVGLRGTAGLSSRTGIIPLSHTQDIGGPLARSVKDLAIMLDVTVGPDPADDVTRAGAGHIPKSFLESLDGAALKGARIGVLRAHFGSAPEDSEVSGIVQKALDAMKAQGAELVDVAIPGLDEPLGGSSLINYEFRDDLARYLAQFPHAPVKSLGEIIARGEMHAALEATFRLRNEAVSDAEALRRISARRAAVVALLEAAFAEHQLDALAYPTLRRRPVVVEEPQRGTNCQLSATTGWPSLALPAGFTPDGVPIGFEIVGRPWSDARLLGLGYAYEQATNPRRPPVTVPALANGRPPSAIGIAMALAREGSTATLDITGKYDPVSGQLTLSLPSSGSGVLAASLHRGAPAKGGPVVVRLGGPGATGPTVSATLPPHLRSAIRAGELWLSVRMTGESAPLWAGSVAFR